MPDQVAAVLSAAVFGSGAVFAWQCARGELAAAALQPALLYSALAALLLPLPLGVLYQVRLFDRRSAACGRGRPCQGAPSRVVSGLALLYHCRSCMGLQWKFWRCSSIRPIWGLQLPAAKPCHA